MGEANHQAGKETCYFRQGQNFEATPSEIWLHISTICISRMGLYRSLTASYFKPEKRKRHRDYFLNINVEEDVRFQSQVLGLSCQHCLPPPGHNARRIYSSAAWEEVAVGP